MSTARAFGRGRYEPEGENAKRGFRVDDATWELAQRDSAAADLMLHHHVRRALTEYLAQRGRTEPPAATVSPQPGNPARLRVLRMTEALSAKLDARAYRDRTTRSGVVAAALVWAHEALAADDAEGAVA